MILRLTSSGELTRSGIRSGYAFTEPVPMVPPVSEIAGALLSWLAAQLTAGESVADVVMEPAGQAATAWQTIEGEDGPVEIPTAFRPVISAAVSVTAPLGARTFAMLSEALPAELRDGLLSAWEDVL